MQGLERQGEGFCSSPGERWWWPGVRGRTCRELGGFERNLWGNLGEMYLILRLRGREVVGEGRAVRSNPPRG